MLAPLPASVRSTAGTAWTVTESKLLPLSSSASAVAVAERLNDPGVVARNMSVTAREVLPSIVPSVQLADVRVTGQLAPPASADTTSRPGAVVALTTTFVDGSMPKLAIVTTSLKVTPTCAGWGGCASVTAKSAGPIGVRQVADAISGCICSMLQAENRSLPLTAGAMRKVGGVDAHAVLASPSC